MAGQAETNRPRVLVVEDEFIIALDLSETVKDLGYEVDGPYRDRRHAQASLGEDMPDCAILDVFTADGEVYPLADRLSEAGVPLIFHSGHVAPREMQQRYPQAQAAAKPCPPDQLITMLQHALDREPESQH
jgi:CheY-like chemotaxis protein